jgi:hypothetical protein
MRSTVRANLQHKPADNPSSERKREKKREKERDRAREREREREERRMTVSPRGHSSEAKIHLLIPEA